MIIHCATCKKLFYTDVTPHRKACPACGSDDATYLSTTIVFGGGLQDKVTARRRAATAARPGREPPRSLPWVSSH